MWPTSLRHGNFLRWTPPRRSGWCGSSRKRGSSCTGSTRDIKLFPRRRASGLLPAGVAVVGEQLRDFFGSAGADAASATIIITDTIDEGILARVRDGARVLRINAAVSPEFPPQTAKVELDLPMEEVGREFAYKLPHALPLDPEGWFKISNWQTTKLQGVKDPESPWWEERELWSSRPEAYQPQFQIILKGVSGETLTTRDETPLVLQRIQQCPAESEQKFLFTEFEWHRDGVPAAVDSLGSVNEIVLVQTKLSGPEVWAACRGCSFLAIRSRARCFRPMAPRPGSSGFGR